MLTVFLMTLAISAASCDQIRVYVFDRELSGTADRCTAETAGFGPSDMFSDIGGVLVNVLPRNACSPVRPPPYKRNDSLAWVALVARDSPGGGTSCYFDRKAANVQAAGYGAMLVYNYDETIIAMQSSGGGLSISIPVAMVTHSCGERLLNFGFSIFGNRFRLYFQDLFSFDFNIYVISFIVIVGVCFLMFVGMWAARSYSEWRYRRRNRLSRSSLKKLKVKKFEKGTDPYECCAICLEDFEPGEKLRILPCNHAYHCKCIDPWLLKNRSNCPVCKRRVFPRRPDESDSDSGDEAQQQQQQQQASSHSERTPLLQGGSGSSSRSGTFDNPTLSLQDEQLEQRRHQQQQQQQRHRRLSESSSDSSSVTSAPEAAGGVTSVSVTSLTDSDRQPAPDAAAADAAADADAGGREARAGSLSVHVFVHTSHEQQQQQQDEQKEAGDSSLSRRV